MSSDLRQVPMGNRDTEISRVRIIRRMQRDYTARVLKIV